MFQHGRTLLLIIGFTVMATAQGRAEWHERVLQQFRGLNGIQPTSGVVIDTLGNVFGTTYLGGRYSVGTVYELTPSQSSQHTSWTQTILHSFKTAPDSGSTENETDGEEPFAAPVIDKKGNLFGTTKSGGRTAGGTVFMLSAPARGQTRWKEQVIHSFHDAGGLNYGLITDPSTNLYGTTSHQGANNLGSVYRLSPPPSGSSKWQIATLFAFAGGANGYFPSSGVTFDSAGNLYGELGQGGANGFGGVFKLAPSSDAGSNWTETLLYSFSSYQTGVGGVIFDSSGNLYGTTYAGGIGRGSVFELVPPLQGGLGWTKHEIYDFGASGFVDGSFPLANVTVDPAGTLYGTTSGGGVLGNGTIFQLTPPAAGQTAWAESLLSSFSKSSGDGGRVPTAGVTIDNEGRLVGTASLGGKGACFSNSVIVGCGTVFQLKQPH